MRRLLVPLPAHAPDRVTLEAERFHYLVHVLRVEVGARLEVFDGAGRSFDGEVIALGATTAELSLTGERRAPVPRPITLIQGLPKADKLEWILQKATELGASAFAPVIAVRSVVKLSVDKAPARHRRWERIAEEAARQSGRSDVPTVAPLGLLMTTCQAFVQDGTQRLLILDEDERALTLSEAALSVGPTAPLGLVVGPEGGFERVEVAELRSLGAIPVTLGRRVLRTETAGMAAVCILRHLEGVLG